MGDFAAVFFDVGGVLGTNGWDTASRKHCVNSFGLDLEEFEDRHQFVADAFETGHLSLEEYLDRTVFYRDRTFSRGEFWEAMKAESQPDREALAVVKDLHSQNRVLLATLNNESRALNEHRIEAFGLRRYFSLFLTSGYLGFKKPAQRIFELALQLTQQRPEQCLFIDDRLLNLECAATEGMATLLFDSPTQLRQDLAVRALLEGTG